MSNTTSFKQSPGLSLALDHAENGPSGLPATSPQALKHAQLNDRLVGAARLGDFTTLCQLLEEGLDPNFQDAKGDSALHYCAEHGCGKLVELLLGKGAEIDICDKSGSTPLHRAAWVRFSRLGDI